MSLRDATVLARRRPAAMLATGRPRQWIKNLLVLAAPLGANALGHSHVLEPVIGAFVAFCMLASGVYAINDVRDVEDDRRHPLKRHRPVASGELGRNDAVMLGVVLIASGLALSVIIQPVLGLVAAGYVGLQLTYALVWRHVVVLDVLAVAGGFLLRALAGGAAARVEISEWFLLVVSCAAVLVAAGKRWAELRRTQRSGERARRVMTRYTARRLWAVIVLSALGALGAYAAWAAVVPVRNGVPWRPLTIAPFAICLLRYALLVRRGDSETPEELILRDRPLQLGAGAWLALFAVGLNAGG